MLFENKSLQLKVQKILKKEDDEFF